MENLPRRPIQHVFVAFDTAFGAEADIAVRPHEHCTLPSDFPLGPGAPCIDLVAFKDADPHGDQINAIAFCKL